MEAWSTDGPDAAYDLNYKGNAVYMGFLKAKILQVVKWIKHIIVHLQYIYRCYV